MSTENILGEIVAWSVSGETAFPTLVKALEDSHFESTLARRMLPRHAFARACKMLTEQRIIRKLDESVHTITFQFTTERKEGNQLKYDFETKLELRKQDGAITCTSEVLKARAQRELDRCLSVRKAADVTRLIQRMFTGNADLFPVRDQGGAYFVPKKGLEFVSRVEGFLGRVGGRLKRFPIAAGTARGQAAVKSAISEGLFAVLAEHRKTIEAFDGDTRETTMFSTVARVIETRAKINSYNLYLEDARPTLLSEVEALLKLVETKRVALVAAPVS